MFSEGYSGALGVLLLGERAHRQPFGGGHRALTATAMDTYLEHQAASIRRPVIWLGTMRT